MDKNLLILVAIVLGLMTGGVLVKKKSNQPITAKECPITNYSDNNFEYKSDLEPFDFQKKEINPEIKRLPEEKPQSQPQPRYYYYQPGNPPSS